MNPAIDDALFRIWLEAVTSAVQTGQPLIRMELGGSVVTVRRVETA